MKNKFSILVCILSIGILLFYRFNYYPNPNDNSLKVTTWDSFGYYAYLPGYFIYDDVTELSWMKKIDNVYELSNGDFYQAGKIENGNYVFKYLGGVAILELPFFGIGHFIASNTDYPADGFSPPYQYSLAFGVIFYFILALFLLRRILLRYYDDFTTSITLLSLVLATNLIQYVGVDGGQSHGYIFPLYVLIIYFTIKWHEAPKIIWASLIGLTIGFASICRPTEIIMLFIPLLWNLQSKTDSKQKWNLVNNHKNHIFWAIVFGLIGILPQLIYWKSVTGSFIHDVGSKWLFFNPYLRVLFGWESGWFIYTPISIFFITGLFFIKKFAFNKSVIIFSILNIWIVIAWFDWKYGATYSTRALVQSYPIFALAFGGLVDWISKKKWKWLIYIPIAYLILVNLFQLHQYNKTILHSRDMNRNYYSAIYLNPSPTPLDMSLLDTDERLKNSSKYISYNLYIDKNEFYSKAQKDSKTLLQQIQIPVNTDWIKISCNVNSIKGFGNSYISYEIGEKDSYKTKDIRLFNALTNEQKVNKYEFFIRNEFREEPTILNLYISTLSEFQGKISSLKIIGYTD